jgi:hypothetical protein
MARLRPPRTFLRARRAHTKCLTDSFADTDRCSAQPNTRRNRAAFPIASRVRRNRQRLRSNGLIESAASGIRGLLRTHAGGTSDKS